jgi:hypothetical protein
VEQPALVRLAQVELQKRVRLVQKIPGLRVRGLRNLRRLIRAFKSPFCAENKKGWLVFTSHPRFFREANSIFKIYNKPYFLF